MRFFYDSDAASLASESGSRILNDRVLRAQSFLFDIAIHHMRDKLVQMGPYRLERSDKRGRALTCEALIEEIIGSEKEKSKKL